MVYMAGSLGTTKTDTDASMSARLLPLPLPPVRPFSHLGRQTPPEKVAPLGRRVLRWRQPNLPHSEGCLSELRKAVDYPVGSQSDRWLSGPQTWCLTWCFQNNYLFKVQFAPEPVGHCIHSHSLVENSCQHGPQIIVTMRACRHCRTFRFVALSTFKWRCDNADVMLTVATATATAQAAATIAASGAATATMHLAAERCNHLMPHYLAHFDGPKNRYDFLGANFPQASDNFPRHFHHLLRRAGPAVSLASQRRRINEKSFHFNSFSLKNTPYTFHVHKSREIEHCI